MGNQCTPNCDQTSEQQDLSIDIQRQIPEQSIQQRVFQKIINHQRQRIAQFSNNFPSYTVQICICTKQYTQSQYLSIKIDKELWKFYEHSDIDSSQILHLVHAGSFLGQNSIGEGITLTMMNNKRQDRLMTTVFIGKYIDRQESQGMYLSFKWFNNEQQIFIFKGTKQNNQYKGFKLSLKNNSWDKFWGNFDQNYVIQGKGKHLYFSGQHCEFYQGNLVDGNKQQGYLKMFDFKELQNNPNLKNLKNQNLEFNQQISELKNLIQLQRNQKQICRKLIEIINKAASLQPILDIYFVQNKRAFKLMIEGTWKDDKIEGFTKQIWPSVNYKFVGMYKANERHGYGQEYQDDILISKGFYSHNKMALMKNNQNLYKGYKYIDSQSSRIK